MAAGENDAKIPSGFILVNKPPGPTSHDVVDELRAITGISQIGHAGTLDPLAEGLLIILIGQYTKEAQNFVKLSKAYRAVLRLGFESNTHDIDGEIIQFPSGKMLKLFWKNSEEKFRKCLRSFRQLK